MVTLRWILAVVMVTMSINHATCQIVSPGIPGNNYMRTVADWCGNFTSYLKAVTQTFGSIAFNKSDSVMKSGLQESTRLAFDRQHLRIYAMLFNEVHPNNSTTQGRKIENCIKTNNISLHDLTENMMRKAERYLNGQIPSPPKLLSSTTKLRYESMAKTMGSLKAQLRDLAIILGEAYIVDIVSK